MTERIQQDSCYGIAQIHSIDLFSYVCKLPIADHVMLWREFFLCVSENYSFIFTRICLNLKEIVLKDTIAWSTLGQQTSEAKEVYSILSNVNSPQSRGPDSGSEFSLRELRRAQRLVTDNKTYKERTLDTISLFLLCKRTKSV